MNTFKHFLIIQAEQADLQIVRCLPASKVGGPIQLFLNHLTQIDLQASPTNINTAQVPPSLNQDDSKVEVELKHLSRTT